MSSILAFAGSNSSTSINYALVRYTATLIQSHKIILCDMAQRPFPMYSEDYEKEHGFSDALSELRNEIKNASALIISVNEHNSYPSAYFKNVMDWLSRMDVSFLEGKKILLMSTSKGGRGAKGALEAAEKMLNRFKGEVKETFSLPHFQENFSQDLGISNTALANIHREKVDRYLKSI
ncbi:MAG: NAD(P)H-dependent oxidoreductase [Maribacter sp.]